jgi:hypothetical protein
MNNKQIRPMIRLPVSSGDFTFFGIRLTEAACVVTSFQKVSCIGSQAWFSEQAWHLLISRQTKF